MGDQAAARARRALPDRSARDWVIVRLGVPGVVRSIVVDTAFFTGNYPQACSADACSASGYPAFEEIAADSEAVTWQEIVPRGAGDRGRPARLQGQLRDAGPPMCG